MDNTGHDTLLYQSQAAYTERGSSMSPLSYPSLTIIKMDNHVTKIDFCVLIFGHNHLANWRYFS